MLTKLLRRTTALALLLAAPFAFAQDPAPTAPTKDADPALWVVKDADTTIYLFGTVHLLKPGLSWFDEAVKKAFDESGELVTELGSPPDPATVQPLMMKYGVSMTGPSLTEKLPEAKRAAFAKALADFGLPQNVIDRFDPWLAGTQLSMLALVKAGYDPKSGVEEALHGAAAAAKKPISGLETIEQQFGFFDSLSEPAQMLVLTEAVDKLDSAAAEFDKLVGEWAEGDAEGLAVMMNVGLRSSPELSKVLLADRNARWADWIKTRLDKPGVVFLAVGAGHLAGSDSVQAMLAKRSVKSERIAY
ncbi:TraB/GumN family protein [Sphingomonas sp. MG17]|uniref:TraB/GumN family protein n=1 Tax=Sphingomonas tagetis TaxID=2949092 RepID=A0A9X2KNK4_9SPHN|nr:TraB/GumN family protein [Sphingomonas tagetis]MCP3732955.1 TraB/GumN family protein [Sphingomonas tagetis]